VRCWCFDAFDQNWQCWGVGQGVVVRRWTQLGIGGITRLTLEVDDLGDDVRPPGHDYESLDQPYTSTPRAGADSDLGGRRRELHRYGHRGVGGTVAVNTFTLEWYYRP